MREATTAVTERSSIDAELRALIVVRSQSGPLRHERLRTAVVVPSVASETSQATAV